MRQGTLIGPIIIAIGLIVASISFALVGAVLKTAEGDTELRMERAEAQVEGMRDEIARLKEELRTVRGDIARVTEGMALLASQRPTAAPDSTPVTPNIDEIGDHPETEELTEVMKLAASRFNKGLTQPGNRVMLEFLGRPRSTFSENCQPVTQAKLMSLLETRQVGPIRATMIRPALESLERIMARLKESEPDIYDAVGTAGGLCARLIRGSNSSISNHSWGTAIDLKLEDRLDSFADGGTQFGLLILAELFNDEGWYWGATYSREDSMHFEVSVEALRRWATEGSL